MIASVRERQGALAESFADWPGYTLHAALDRAAAVWSDRPYVITDDRIWSYAEIAVWSNRLAAGLEALGINAGDKVAIILANYPEFVALKFAIARLGAVAVPINMLNRRDELRYLLDQSDAAVLVTMDRFRDNDYLQVLDEIAPGWEVSGGGSALPTLRKVIVFATSDTSERPSATPFSALDAEGLFGSVDVAPTDLCDIIYTSGTTGSPKGVMITHDMLTRTAFGAAYGRAFEEGHRIIFSLPMYHVFGYVEGLLAVLWVGGALIPQLRFDPGATLDGIARHHATDALLIPTMTLAVLDAVEAAPHDLSSLHFVLASGGRAPERLWQAIYDRLGVKEITTGYGMTETTATTILTRPDDEMSRLLNSNGRHRDAGPAGDPALGGSLVQYQVIDPETGTERAPGEMGELVARGPGVTAGYYNKPEATAAAFTPDGWLRTGDLGRIDADGYLSLMGRSKESYRCGGELVMPTEVEDVLMSRADVLQAHIVPIPDERMGEVGVAFVVARPGAAPDVRALRAAVEERVARFKVPRHFFIVEEGAIPITASGRARKFLLSEQALAMVEKS